MISLPPDEVERRFSILGIPNRFTAREKQQLATTPVVETPASVLAFPTPEDSSGLNILNLRRLLGVDPSRQPSFFDHPWYLDEPFAIKDCSPGWHILHMNVLPDSISKPINYARSLESRRLELPSAIEISLMLFLHYVGGAEQLLQKKHTWCGDEASLNRFVTVGAFGRNGLFVSGHPGDYSSRGLGICAKFRLNRFLPIIL
jgi:hypothetical protein